ncbi:MAG: hypothetical protein LBR25_02800 [Erysipelotrichaceae bacterium]|jgi:tRNA-binding protein|nr:hypothetical protein [Erysipelotrichaceae bacterium]
MSTLRLFKADKPFGPYLYLLAGKPESTDSCKQYGAITVLYHQDEIIGYNIAGDILKGEPQGYLPWDKERKQVLMTLFAQNGVPFSKMDEQEYLVVGQIKSLQEHPASEHLSVVQVDTGSAVVQIVCGSNNLRSDMKVIVALPGAVLPEGRLIEAGKVLQVDSYGMICSARELGLDWYTPQSGALRLLAEEKTGTTMSRLDWRKYHVE